MPATVNRPRSPRSFHRYICEQGLSEPITLPPEPPGKCSSQLQSRIADLLEKAQRGVNLGTLFLILHSKQMPIGI